VRIFKKRILWFILYGIVITFVFLYLLFPGELVKKSLEASINSPDLIFRSQSLGPALPYGIKLKNIVLSSAKPGNVFFQGNVLYFQPALLSFFQKNAGIDISGSAYGGSFSGSLRLPSFNRLYPPVEAKLTFSNIDLGHYPLLKSDLGQQVSGIARGKISYNGTSTASPETTGALTLYLTKGVYQFAEPLLGMSRMDFDRGEIQATLKNGIIKIDKLEISGTQLNISLKGDITIAPDLKNSALNLTGVIQVLTQNKMKVNVTIGGTLANPVSRYI
jgi:type II secretion system protein N